MLRSTDAWMPPTAMFLMLLRPLQTSLESESNASKAWYSEKMWEAYSRLKRCCKSIQHIYPIYLSFSHSSMPIHRAPYRILPTWDLNWQYRNDARHCLHNKSCASRLAQALASSLAATAASLSATWPVACKVHAIRCIGTCPLCINMHQ